MRLTSFGAFVANQMANTAWNLYQQYLASQVAADAPEAGAVADMLEAADIATAVRPEASNTIFST